MTILAILIVGTLILVCLFGLEGGLAATSIACAAVLLLGACTSAREVYTSDGRKGLAIKCSGTANSWGSCFQKAGEVCGERGYEILMRNAETGQVAAVNYTPGIGLNGYSNTTQGRELMVACRG